MLFLENKEEVAGEFEQKSVGEKQEFVVMTVPHWLSYRSGSFLFVLFCYLKRLFICLRETESEQQRGRGEERHSPKQTPL